MLLANTLLLYLYIHRTKNKVNLDRNNRFICREKIETEKVKTFFKQNEN